MENRNRLSKSKIMVAIIKGKIASIVGWPLAVFWVIGLIIYLSPSDMTSGDKASGLLISIIFELIGIALIVYGIKIKKKVKRFRRYIDIILNNNQIVVDNIASIVGKPINIVMTDLQKMIDKGYFKGAHIDKVSHEIVLDRRSENGVSNKVDDSVELSSVKVVECKSCGAKNQVRNGSYGECEFCGSPLEIK